MRSIEVVHMKNYGKESKEIDGNTVYIYCGRPSKLGNPYFMANESQRQTVIDKCAKDDNFNHVVDEFIFWLEASPYSSVKLGCFCAPKACHCDIIKSRVLKAQSL